MYVSFKVFPDPDSPVAPLVLVTADDSAFAPFWKGAFEQAFNDNGHARVEFSESLLKGLEYGRPRLVFVGIDGREGYANLKQACLLAEITDVRVVALSARDIYKPELLRISNTGAHGLLCLDEVPTAVNLSTAIHYRDDYLVQAVRAIRRLVACCVLPITVEVVMSHDDLVTDIPADLFKQPKNETNNFPTAA